MMRAVCPVYRAGERDEPDIVGCSVGLLAIVSQELHGPDLAVEVRDGTTYLHARGVDEAHDLDRARDVGERLVHRINGALTVISLSYRGVTVEAICDIE